MSLAFTKLVPFILTMLGSVEFKGTKFGKTSLTVTLRRYKNGRLFEKS